MAAVDPPTAALLRRGALQCDGSCCATPAARCLAPGSAAVVHDIPISTDGRARSHALLTHEGVARRGRFSRARVVTGARAAPGGRRGAAALALDGCPTIVLLLLVASRTDEREGALVGVGGGGPACWSVGDAATLKSWQGGGWPALPPPAPVPLQSARESRTRWLRFASAVEVGWRCVVRFGVWFFDKWRARGAAGCSGAGGAACSPWQARGASSGAAGGGEAAQRAGAGACCSHPLRVCADRRRCVCVCCCCCRAGAMEWRS